MRDPNFFSLFHRVTSRIEPLHSEALGLFLELDPDLTERLMRRALPDELIARHDLTAPPEVTTEEVLPNHNRIDITLRYSTLLVGIEVKTSDASSTSGQLSRYLEQLQMIERYQDLEPFMIYLTPFNRASISEEIDIEQVKSVREFDDFEARYPNRGAHLNWRDVSDLYPEGAPSPQLGAMYDQHRAYIEEYLCDLGVFKMLQESRGLTKFFGEEHTTRFLAIFRHSAFFTERAKDYVITLSDLDGQERVVIDALLALLRSPELKHTARKSNEVSSSSVWEGFTSGPHGLFFERLFAEVASVPHAWFKGEGRLGLRAAHPRHSSGVSVCTLSPEELVIRKFR